MKNWFKNRYLKYRSFKNECKQTRRVLYHTLDFFETIIVALIFALLIKAFVLQVSVVPTGSMIPTLIGGVDGKFNDRLFVNKFIYYFTEPKRGDIVVFKSPHLDGKDYVKRCVGLPGDTIEIRQGIVYINGNELILVGVDIQRDYDYYGPKKIPENSYFMLGDNRSKSLDSRSWGFVDSRDIQGKALFTFWPINQMRALR